MRRNTVIGTIITVGAQTLFNMPFMGDLLWIEKISWKKSSEKQKITGFPTKLPPLSWEYLFIYHMLLSTYTYCRSFMLVKFGTGPVSWLFDKCLEM